MKGIQGRVYFKSAYNLRKQFLQKPIFFNGLPSKFKPSLKEINLQKDLNAKQFPRQLESSKFPLTLAT